MPGPACWMAAPEPTKSPAPMTPAMAIIDRCLGLRDLESCWSACMKRRPSWVVAGRTTRQAVPVAHVLRTTMSFHTRPAREAGVLCDPTDYDTSFEAHLQPGAPAGKACFLS